MSLIVRTLNASDDLVRLTQLIHSACAAHTESGLRYWGTHQTVEDTAYRLSTGIGFLLLHDDEYLGTILVRPSQPTSPVMLYRNPGVFTFAQFCVSPAHKGKGLGHPLHSRAVDHARTLGGNTMALDTAKAALRLIAMYETWGYEVVGTCDWRPKTNYESAVMAMPLTQSAESAP